ncbi:hypothetical protein GWK47_028405 [Chionoecetes opilio]|uniref:Uncharacterized protein n=1 Tax=Chionoecetes opilio TaxID=41210 RepID=A0A8J5D3J4_CHIOP|nr:hypothetical protein GWK47_028405 [Chionoecetes opilio]
MCELKPLQATGITMAVFITFVGLGTEGFYAWKVYEVDHCVNITNNSINAAYDFCLDDRNQSDVCFHAELEVRSYVGLVEGIVATVAGICFIIGFALINLPLIWTWVVWALGITSYNAYCIYDYYTTLTDCVDASEFWDTFIELDYGYYFVTVLTSVCCYTLCLWLLSPRRRSSLICVDLSRPQVGPDSTSVGSYECK